MSPITITILVISMIAVVIIMGAISVFLFLLNAARNKKQATFVPEANIEFVTAGEGSDDPNQPEGTIVKVLPNIPGFYYEPGEVEIIVPVGKERRDDNSKNIVGYTHATEPVKVKRAIIEGFDPQDYRVTIDPTNPTQNKANVDKKREEIRKKAGTKLFSSYRLEWLEMTQLYTIKGYFKKRWGFFWVGISFPLRKIMPFSITKTRLKKSSTHTVRPSSGNESLPEAPVDSLIEYEDEPTEVTSLRWIFPRPIYAENVEFKERTTANIVVQAMFQTILPRKSPTELKGDFFPLLEANVKAGIINITREMGIIDFVNLDKDEQSEFTFGMQRINYNPETKKGLVTEMGFMLIDCFVIAYQASDKALITALSSKEIARLQGEALIVKSLAETESIRLIGEQKAKILKLKVNAGGEKVVIAEFNSDRLLNLKDTKLTTLVESGQANVLLGHEQATKTETRE